MSRRVLDLRDHPVLAIIAGFCVIALVSVPALLALSEPSEGPPGGDDGTIPGTSSQTPAVQAPKEPGRLTVAQAQPVEDVAAMVVSQDAAFPGYRAQLLTMAPQVDESAPAVEEGEDGQLDEAPEETTSAEAARVGWVEVYALTPADAPSRAPGEPTVQEAIGLLVRSGDGGVRTRQVIGEDLERESPQQIVAASYDAGTVVWEETPSTDVAELPFVLYTWSSGSGETIELTRSDDVAGKPAPPVPGFTGPILRGRTVLWSQVADVAEGEPGRTDVYGCLIDECEPQVVRRDAAYPTAGPEGFALLARNDPAAPGKASLVEVGGDLEPVGELRALPVEVNAVTGFAGASTGYVLLEAAPREPTRAVLLDGAADEDPLEIVGPAAGGFVYAVAGPRLRAWGFAGAANEPVGGYAYDRATGDVLSLGDSSERYSVAVAGGRVAFQLSAERPDGLPAQRVALLD